MKQMISLNTIKTQIADSLNVLYSQIKSVEEWANCFFVTFFNRRPRFVSKKVLASLETKAATLISYCKVIAHTAIRQNGFRFLEAGKQRGLLLQDLKTGEQFWQNNRRLDLCDPLKGSVVKVTEFDNGWITLNIV